MAFSPDWIAQFQLTFDWSILLRLSLAALLGGIVGAEREFKRSPGWVAHQYPHCGEFLLIHDFIYLCIPPHRKCPGYRQGCSPDRHGGRLFGCRRSHPDEKGCAWVDNGSYHLDGCCRGYGNCYGSVPDWCCNNDLDHNSTCTPWTSQHLVVGKSGYTPTPASRVIPTPG